ncbi:MAG TPA: serine hydrolase domain-containing protein [Candidatus Solibacter sp.]|nr:serine hydrolase domain-containing protein [Candidatus Solibacter sp.]
MLRWIFVLIGLLLFTIAGMWVFVSINRPVLHPNPQAIRSATQTVPSARWSEATERARRIILASLAEGNLPGLSVAVGVGSDLVWSEGFGWANVETHAPVTPDARFRIGTASTVLTSAAAGVLLERGRLRLDDEIQTYVPQFPKKQWPVTLRQLMADVAGTGTDGGDDGPVSSQRCEHPVEAVPQFAGDALLFEPGTQYRHSKYGWILVSAAVEAAGAQPFLGFMREQIYQPLHMDHTGAESATEENPDRLGEEAEDAPFITGIRDVILQPLTGGRTAASMGQGTGTAPLYAPGFGRNPIFRYGVHVMRPRNLSCYAGSIAFFSTPSDVVRFSLAINSGTLLKRDTVRLLQEPQRLSSGQETGHGLGWNLKTVTLSGEPVQAIGGDGELLGKKTGSLMMFREAGIVVVVMSNLSSADTPGLALKVAEAFAQRARR